MDSAGALGSVGTLLAASDASVQQATRKLIEEIVVSVLKARESLPEVIKEKMLARRLQEVVQETHSSTKALSERMDRFEVALKKRMKDCEDKVGALSTAVETLSTKLDSRHESVTKELSKLSELRDEFNEAISKERHRRLKLFTRWIDVHGEDLEKLNLRMNREFTYMSQRSNHEFKLQSESLETIKDKLDYALMKRYGYIPDIKASYMGTQRIVGGYADEELQHGGDEEDEDLEKDATSGGSRSQQASTADYHLPMKRQQLLQPPRLKGAFNLAADAGLILTGLDSRIDALAGKVQGLAKDTSLVAEAQSWDAMRRLRVRNDGSEDGSVSASDYGYSDDEEDVFRGVGGNSTEFGRKKSSYSASQPVTTKGFSGSAQQSKKAALPRARPGSGDIKKSQIPASSGSVASTGSFRSLTSSPAASTTTTTNSRRKKG